MRVSRIFDWSSRIYDWSSTVDLNAVFYMPTSGKNRNIYLFKESWKTSLKTGCAQTSLAAQKICVAQNWDESLISWDKSLISQDDSLVSRDTILVSREGGNLFLSGTVYCIGVGYHYYYTHLLHLLVIYLINGMDRNASLVNWVSINFTSLNKWNGLKCKFS